MYRTRLGLLSMKCRVIGADLPRSNPFLLSKTVSNFNYLPIFRLNRTDPKTADFVNSFLNFFFSLAPVFQINYNFKQTVRVLSDILYMIMEYHIYISYMYTPYFNNPVFVNCMKSLISGPWIDPAFVKAVNHVPFI